MKLGAFVNKPNWTDWTDYTPTNSNIKIGKKSDNSITNEARRGEL